MWLDKSAGATDRIRTYDPLITNEMLYQLSYSSIEQMNYTIVRERIARGFCRRTCHHPVAYHVSNFIKTKSATTEKSSPCGG